MITCLTWSLTSNTRTDWSTKYKEVELIQEHGHNNQHDKSQEHIYFAGWLFVHSTFTSLRIEHHRFIKDKHNCNKYLINMLEEKV